MPSHDSKFKELTFLTASKDPVMLKQYINGVTLQTRQDLQYSLAFQFRKFGLCAHGCRVEIKNVIKFPGSNNLLFALQC